MKQKNVHHRDTVYFFSLSLSSFQQSSGLGKLMSALHKNAESLVTTKAEHNGPDQVLGAADFTSSVRNKAVTIRREEAGLGAEEPLSVPSLLQQVRVLCCYEIITAWHDNHGKWHCAMMSSQWVVCPKNTPPWSSSVVIPIK